jgi:hypothetical protein
MDTRQISPAIRRRVGQGASAYLATDQGQVIRSVPITTDWAAIEAVFAAKTASVGSDYIGSMP